MNTHSDKVTFYYNPMSRGRIVHWMLEESHANYEIKLLKWEANDHKSQEYLKVNPMGQIPAIVHRGVTVTETAAICAYLADAFPQARLAPEHHSPLRGAYYRWMFFAASSVEYAMFDRLHPRVKTPSSSHIGYSSHEDVVRTLEQAIGGGYLVGDRFSAADLFLSASLGWCFFSKALEPRPALVNYVKRCEDRPAHRKYLEQAGPIGT